MNPFDRFAAAVDGVLACKPSAGMMRSARCYCPSHQLPPHRTGRGRTLVFSETSAGDVVMHCHAGCAVDDVAQAAGLTLSDLFAESASSVSTTHSTHSTKPNTRWRPVMGHLDHLDELAFELSFCGGHEDFIKKSIVIGDAVRELRKLVSTALRSASLKGNQNG